MEPVFSQKYEIAAIHLDCFGRVKPSVLLHFAQEVAGAHCMDLSLDWDTLHEKHMFWAVIRHRVQITRLPTAGETITVETWPMPTTRVAFPRSTVGYDANGNEVFRSISLWVLMDTRTRAMILPGKSGVVVNGTVRGTELAVPNSLIPRTLGSSVLRTVGYSELDRNGHMNNTKYLDWVDDLLPSAYHAVHPVKEITVCYLSEALEGQQLHLDWELSEGPVLTVDAHREKTDVPGEKERVFSAKIEF